MNLTKAELQFAIMLLELCINTYQQKTKECLEKENYFDAKANTQICDQIIGIIEKMSRGLNEAT